MTEVRVHCSLLVSHPEAMQLGALSDWAWPVTGIGGPAAGGCFNWNRENSDGDGEWSALECKNHGRCRPEDMQTIRVWVGRSSDWIIGSHPRHSHIPRNLLHPAVPSCLPQHAVVPDEPG